MGDKGRKDKIKQEKQHKIANKKKLHPKALGKVHGGGASPAGLNFTITGTNETGVV
jgi:hypothetical protein